jgi:Tfp pilus assembly ATPase PilU
MDQALRDLVRAGQITEATALGAAADPEELRIELLRS